MFNRITISPRPQTVHQYTHISEQRAPTDESVKLLKEFQEKAEAKVVASVAVESNTFNCVVHTWVEPMSDRTIARAIFDMNGHKMNVQEDISRMENSDKEKLILKLRDSVAVKIATEMLLPALRKVRL
jgi:hypothetical protein